MSMIPLQKSHEATALEGELKALLIKLYDESMLEVADDINVYGVPHLGSFSLVERFVTEDGLAVLRQSDEAGIRYIFKAWRHRNPQRGFHFLRTYLRVIFGEVSEVNQMWQSRSGTYPQNLRSLAEIGYSGESLDDYFLTSRVVVDIDTDVIPDRIIRSLASTVPARILLDVRVAKRVKQLVGAPHVFRSVVVARTAGMSTASADDKQAGVVCAVAQAFGSSVLAFTSMVAPRD